MLRIYAYLYIAALYAPILLIVLFSFNSAQSLSFPIEGLSLRWYAELFDNPTLLQSFKNSIMVGVTTTIVTTIIGSLAALSFARLKGRAKDVFGFLSFSPIALPGLFVGIALLILFAQLGIAAVLGDDHALAYPDHPALFHRIQPVAAGVFRSVARRGGARSGRIALRHIPAGHAAHHRADPDRGRDPVVRDFL